MKRAFDVIAAVILLLALSPLFLVLIILIVSSMGKPVFFRQQRPGLDARPFSMIKFRTMTDRCDQSGNLLSDEERLTRVGRFLRRSSLDELPELINILRGEMSFVGPRPLLMEYLPLYSNEQSRRHQVRPGLTGWAQVNGRNAISWPDKFSLDVWYVENQSLWLDIRILLMTVVQVLRSDGITQAGHATTEPFRGER